MTQHQRGKQGDLRSSRLGSGNGLVVLLGGIGGVGVAAVLAGDWWLARKPLVGIGLTLFVLDLGVASQFETGR